MDEEVNGELKAVTGSIEELKLKEGYACAHTHDYAGACTQGAKPRSKYYTGFAVMICGGIGILIRKEKVQ